MAISEQLQRRSDLIGTQVITRDTGKRLGVVNQLWVDIDQRAVIALGLRGTLVTGEQQYMHLDNIRQVGDVILVDNEEAIEPINTLNYSTLINHEVITETGQLLGKVRGFKFDTVNGEIASLIIASLGIPLMPDIIISTYELPVEQIVSTGPDRIIVFEGTEDRMQQLTVGLLERMGLGGAPWEEGDEDYIPTRTPTSNQLGSGLKTTPYTPPRKAAPAQDVWAEDDAWDAPPAAVGRAEEARRTFDREPNRWDKNAEPDAWADAPEDEPYEAPPLKLPERQKVAEYEREEY